MSLTLKGCVDIIKKEDATILSSTAMKEGHECLEEPAQVSVKSPVSDDQIARTERSIGTSRLFEIVTSLWPQFLQTGRQAPRHTFYPYSILHLNVVHLERGSLTFAMLRVVARLNVDVPLTRN